LSTSRRPGQNNFITQKGRGKKRGVGGRKNLFCRKFHIDEKEESRGKKRKVDVLIATLMKYFEERIMVFISLGTNGCCIQNQLK